MSSNKGIELLASFVKLQEQLADCRNEVEVNHLVLCQLSELVSASSAMFCRMSAGKVQFVAASDTSSVDQGAVFTKEVLATLTDLGETISEKADIAFAKADENFSIVGEWQDANVVILPVKSPEKLHGFVIFFVEAVQEDWIPLLGRMSKFCSIAYRPYIKNNLLEKWRAVDKKKKRLLLAVIFLCICFPVRLSVVGRAEVIAKQPEIISAPISGIVSEIHVFPGEQVEQGDLLISFDKREITAKLEVVKKSTEVARAELLKVTDESLTCLECRHRIPELEQRYQQKKREEDFVSSQLQAADVYASSSGIVVIGDKDKFVGRFVNVGERLVYVAQENQNQLKISLGLDDLIEFSLGETDVRFFPITNPFNSYDLVLDAVAYEPVTSGQETFYVLYASFSGQDVADLGARGSAKIKTGYVPMAYYLLRKPLGWLRTTIGI